MRKNLNTVLLLVAILSLAQPLTAQKYAPLPKQIIEAKTIAILNLTKEPKVEDAVYRQIRALRRFEIRYRAELLIVLYGGSGRDTGYAIIPFGGSGLDIPIRSRFITLDIFHSDTCDKEKCTPIWSCSRGVGLFDSLAARAKSCAKEFRKRFPKEPKKKL